jgi:hypothetical protein
VPFFTPFFILISDKLLLEAYGAPHLLLRVAQTIKALGPLPYNYVSRAVNSHCNTMDSAAITPSTGEGSKQFGVLLGIMIVHNLPNVHITERPMKRQPPPPVSTAEPARDPSHGQNCLQSKTVATPAMFERSQII